jgi:MarR family transcriptional repressor of emrRAB
VSDFGSAERRLAVTYRRYPTFPRRQATLLRLIKHIHKEMSDRANAILKPHGINYPEYNLLMMIYGTDGDTISPSELAAAAGEKSANITRLTDQLGDKGLIARAASADDRRKVEVKLTPAGLALLERALPDVCEWLRHCAPELNTVQERQLETLLKRMLSGFGD